MNKHIELVKKWLADPESVSQKELEDNARAAYDAYDDAVNAAYRAAYWAAYWAAYGYTYTAAAYWVKRYKELTK